MRSQLLSAIIAKFGITMLFCVNAAAQDVRFQVFDRADKKVLTIYPKSIENADGNVMLRFDANTKKIENADGKTILQFDGEYPKSFHVRNPKDDKVRLAWSDGQFVRKTDTHGKVFLYYDARDLGICPNIGERRLYSLHRLQNGNHTLSGWQVIGLAYLLKPEGFKVSDDELKAQREAFDAAGKEEEIRMANRLSGNFMIINSSTSSLGKGKAMVTPVGKYFSMGYQFKDGQSLKGIGLFMPGASFDNEQIFTALSPDGAVGLGVYEIKDGLLDGKWYPTTLLADGKINLGIEKLKGKTGEDLSGTFAISEAKTPDKGDPYTGTLRISKLARSDYSSTPSYNLEWTIGTFKLSGVGVTVQINGSDLVKRNYLVVAVGTGNAMVGQHWTNVGNNVHLDFALQGSKIAGSTNGGTIYLTK